MPAPSRHLVGGGTPNGCDLYSMTVEHSGTAGGREANPGYMRIDRGSCGRRTTRRRWTLSYFSGKTRNSGLGEGDFGTETGATRAIREPNRTYV